MIASVEGRRGLGTHASLSRFDLHNTLIAAGPDLKPGYVSHLPSGNIDLAPTVLHVLGVVPPQPMDGRVLSEALQDESAAFPKPDQKVLEATRDLGVLRWRQTLKTTRVGYSLYFDEGNGASQVRP